MNPLTQIKNTQKVTKREIELGLFEKVRSERDGHVYPESVRYLIPFLLLKYVVHVLSM